MTTLQQRSGIDHIYPSWPILFVVVVKSGKLWTGSKVEISPPPTYFDLFPTETWDIFDFSTTPPPLNAKFPSFVAFSIGKLPLWRLIIYIQVFCHELQFPEFTSAVADLKNFVADRNNIEPSYAGLFIFPYLGIVDACGLWTSWLLPTLERELQQPAWSPRRMGDRLVASVL